MKSELERALDRLAKKGAVQNERIKVHFAAAPDFTSSF